MSDVRQRAGRLSADRLTEIYETVVALVLDAGYEATTMEAIAARSGASKATLYRRWTDKPTLVMSAISQISALDFSTIDTGRFVADMEQMMDMLGLRAQQTIALVLTVTEASQHDAALSKVVERYMLPELEALQVICDRAVARGEIAHPERVVHLRHLIVGVLFTSTIFPGSDPSAVDGASLRAYLHDVMLPFVGVAA